MGGGSWVKRVLVGIHTLGGLIEQMGKFMGLAIRIGHDV